MLTILKALRAWRARMANAEAEYWREEADRCALLAHDLDPMCEPLRWGRLQSRANWARKNERAAIAKAAA